MLGPEFFNEIQQAYEDHQSKIYQRNYHSQIRCLLLTRILLLIIKEEDIDI